MPLITLFYKECLVTSFDPEFARAAGFPTQLIHHGIMLLLAFAIVVALQAVGVVLVSAMLITPAAAAYLLTDRMHRMLILAALFGMIAGRSGAFFSFSGNNLPTGPFMVLGASAVFLARVPFRTATRRGRALVETPFARRAHQPRKHPEIDLPRPRRARVSRAKASRFANWPSFAARASRKRASQSRELRRHGFAHYPRGWQRDLLLTPAGWQRACEIVRNHRLWELYLTNAAQFAADHVHEDAEKIEHVLGEESVRELERRLAVREARSARAADSRTGGHLSGRPNRYDEPVRLRET